MKKKLKNSVLFLLTSLSLSSCSKSEDEEVKQFIGTWRIIQTVTKKQGVVINTSNFTDCQGKSNYKFESSGKTIVSYYYNTDCSNPTTGNGQYNDNSKKLMMGGYEYSVQYSNSDMSLMRNDVIAGEKYEFTTTLNKIN
ncbi:hypothetical protein [Chryseobacterium daeguense]|uniref:hypothetical protein n=1 Tax=Chryseobacterium daeguense TaxID=412438 RepID=UPI0004103672|nr:hypothetical protein [Chryseobacterium daeguense]